jgi:hypothetical protein
MRKNNSYTITVPIFFAVIFVNITSINAQEKSGVLHSIMYHGGLSYNSEIILGEIDYLVGINIKEDYLLEAGIGVFNRYWIRNTSTRDRSRYGFSGMIELTKMFNSQMGASLGGNFYSFSLDKFVPSIRVGFLRKLKKGKLKLMLSGDRSRDISVYTLGQVVEVPHKFYCTVSLGFIRSIRMNLKNKNNL